MLPPSLPFLRDRALLPPRYPACPALRGRSFLPAPAEAACKRFPRPDGAATSTYKFASIYWLPLSLLTCTIAAWGLWWVVCMHRGRDPRGSPVSIAPTALADAVCLFLGLVSALHTSCCVLGTKELCSTCTKRFVCSLVTVGWGVPAVGVKCNGGWGESTLGIETTALHAAGQGSHAGTLCNKLLI